MDWYLITAVLFTLVIVGIGVILIWLALRIFGAANRPDELRSLASFNSVLRETDEAPDFYIERVRRKFLERSVRGVAKYGTNLERTDLTTREWMVHAQEEAMDFAAYLEVLIHRVEKGSCNV